MHTKDKLAAALTEIGAEQLAKEAGAGLYDDFISPLAVPQMALAGELTKIGTAQAMALRERVINGDFDSTEEEADAWAESEEGLSAMKLFEAAQADPISALRWTGSETLRKLAEVMDPSTINSTRSNLHGTDRGRMLAALAQAIDRLANGEPGEKDGSEPPAEFMILFAMPSSRSDSDTEVVVLGNRNPHKFLGLAQEWIDRAKAGDLPEARLPDA